MRLFFPQTDPGGEGEHGAACGGDREPCGQWQPGSARPVPLAGLHRPRARRGPGRLLPAWQWPLHAAVHPAQPRQGGGQAGHHDPGGYPRPAGSSEARSCSLGNGLCVCSFLSCLLSCIFPFSRFFYCFLSTSIKSVRYIMIRKNVQSSSLLFGQHLMPKYLLLLLLWSFFRLLFLEEIMFSFQPLSLSALNFIFSSPLFQ